MSEWVSVPHAAGGVVKDGRASKAISTRLVQQLPTAASSTEKPYPPWNCTCGS